MDAQRVQAVFQAALEAADPAARAVVLKRECATDLELSRRVQALLQAYENPASILDRPPVAVSTGTVDEIPSERLGTVIGPYKLLEEIGEGGMGTVWMAQQTEPVKRVVALKLIKAGMDSKQVIARFEAERQALAIMDHPNIAKVLDGGATTSGRPYFVMELVNGVPITEFCDRNQLTPRQRLELIVPVCHAVQHAHQKGIIHRDLKPSNILVVMHETTALPKVIDFGVAKALGQELTDKTLFTGFAQMIGTPLYMSPEQAGDPGAPGDIDTRSDIYSLGVLLYELLTGTTPFTKERFKQAAYDEIRRIIREEDPPKPSTRLSELKNGSPHDPPAESGRSGPTSLHSSLASVAAQRQTEPAQLTKLVRGELDWIVMKALEKDRNQRYETANGLAMDVQRYLADEAVLACPPSVGYRLRKFVRRNRGSVIAASLVVLALLCGIVGTGVGLVHANHANDLKDEALRRELQIAYFRRVALAQRELEANNVGRSKQLLDECPAYLRGWEWLYLNRLRYGSLAPLTGHSGGVCDVTMSADGRHIVSAGDNTLKIWDASTGRCLHTLTGHSEEVQCVAISPDGSRYASGCSGGTVRLWDAALKQELCCLRDHTASVTSVAFSPDGRWLASASSDGTVRLRDPQTARAIRTLAGHTRCVTAVAFSPDSRLLASSTVDSSVTIWDSATGDEIRTLKGHRSEVRYVAFSPDGQHLASGGLDSTVRIWKVDTGEQLHALIHSAPVWALAYTPDGRRLATTGFDTTVKLWDPMNAEEILVLRGHTHIAVGLAFSGNGLRLVSASNDGTIRLYDATPLGDKGPGEVMTLRQDDKVLAVDYSRDGRYLASAGLDQKLTLWDQPTGRRLHHFGNHDDFIFDLAFSPDGRRVVSASYDRTARVWDSSSGELIRTLLHKDRVSHVAYSPDGRLVASSSEDGIVKIWDTGTWRELTYAGHHGNGAAGVAFSPDGSRVASGGTDGLVHVWQTSNLQDVPYSPLRGHRRSVRDVAFSANGCYLASTSFDATAIIWDAETGQLIHRLEGHKERLWSGVAFTPDSRYLATAALDATVKVWDVASGREVKSFQGHSGLVWNLAISPDGKQLAAATGSPGRGEIRIWDATLLDAHLDPEKD